MHGLKKQIHLCDIFEEVEEYFKKNKPKFIKLFDKYIDLDVLIP